MADERLVKKGMKEPRAALARQVRHHINLLKIHGPELAKRGFSEVKAKALIECAPLLESAVAKQAEKRGKAMGRSRTSP